MSPRVVVVGSGIAGIVAALHASGAGCTVTLVTKGAVSEANTRYAQGGIAGVMFDDDRVADHIADTLTAGAGLSDERAVEVLATEGPDRIRELVDLGVVFDRDADGALRKGLEAAHSYPRVLHAGGDATGLVIQTALVARLRASSVVVVEHAFLVDIDVREGRASGVVLLVDDERRRLDADAVILATGGAGQLYAHTTNPAVATADGVAAALRAGARVEDLEFVQFHPTVLPATADAGAFLVSEAVRGEGAVLVDERGERFAFAAHPDGELAPRDVVARAIARRMLAQDGRPVHLDARARGASLPTRFPTIDRALRERGIDWTRDLVPVTPAAHYLMGGVSTDVVGRTSIPGLYAVGEVARTGVHGANRLASNSLVEGAVFGARAGDAVAADAATGLWPVAPGAGDIRSFAGEPDGSDGEAPAPFSRRALQELMWEDAGLMRTGAGLRRAEATLSAWTARARAARTVAEHEDDNLLLVARAVVDAALRRTASVGAHYRADDAPTTERAVEAVAAC
jgi:L-aspartate oxidase